MPVRAILRQARDRVSDLRVGEAVFDQGKIVLQAGVRHGRHDRNDVLVLELGEESPNQRVLHGFMHEVDVHQRGRISDCGMSAVQDPELHQLVWRDIGHESHAHVFERRTPERKLVFQHPLLEALTENRPAVLDAVVLPGHVDLALARGRRDTVHHRIREGHVVMDPVGEVRIGQTCKTADRRFGDLAIARDVVAAHHREGRNVSLPARPQPGDDQAENGLGMCRILGVGNDRGVCRIEFAGGGIDEIAAFRDRQRNDADIR